MPGTELEDGKPRLPLNRSFFRVFFWKTFTIHIQDITFGIIFSLLFEKPFYHVHSPSATDKKDYFLEQAGETKTLAGISADTTSPHFFCNTQGRSLHSHQIQLGALNLRLTATTIAKVFPIGGETLRRLMGTQRDPIEAGDGGDGSEVFLQL